MDDSARCLAVMYHYVHDRDPLSGQRVSGDESGVRGLTSDGFAAQLDRLCEEMEPIGWPALYAWMCGRGSIPRRCFLLTFDDGLIDHAEIVLPILNERKLRGVFFVAGAGLMSQRMLPAHAIQLLLTTCGGETLERESLSCLAEFAPERGELAKVDQEAAEVLYHYETPTLARLKYLLNIQLPVDLRDSIVDTLFDRFIGSSVRWARHWYLSWDHLVEMQSCGHTIGAHGFSHEPLTRLTRAERRQDANRVAAILTSGLGSDIRPASFPFGRFDDDSCAVLSEAGFAHAFTTQSGWITRDSDVLRLPRVDTIDVDAVLEEEVECATR